jgi:tetratricopeptide (TPR) repeat protein
MIERIVIIWFIMILALPSLGVTAQNEFVESYTYTAGEADSKLTCRMVSLIEVKRLLLERIGTYLESRTEVKDFAIAKDEIILLTGGIVKLEILDERWNGEKYTLTAKIEANPDDVARAIDDLRKHNGKMEKIEKLKEINDTSLEQIREMQSRMQQLQSDLLKLNQDANANQGILNAWGLYERAVELRQSGKVQEAIQALNTVIQNNPTHLAYYERGMAYAEMGRYDEAIIDLTKTLKVEPNMRGALWGRGMSYMKSGKKMKGRQDIEKAAALGQRRAEKWLEEHPGPNKRKKW